MGIRTHWATPESTSVEILDEYTDQYGTGIDEGCVGLALGSDEVFLLEGTLDGIRDLGKRILEACDEYEGVHYCRGCGREELDCSKDPCPDVIADRKS